MIKSYQYLDIDINKKTYKRLRAVQGDSKSRYILVSLYDNSKAYNLSNCSVKVFGCKSDKNIFFNYAIVTDVINGKFEIELTNQALAVAGELEIQILILGTNQERLTSFSFYIDVEKSIVNDGVIESANEFKALTGALSQVEEWNGYFEETSGKIEEKYTERLNNVDSQLEHITNISTTVSVKNYGAKGDGIKDDTEAILNCFEYCTENGCTMYFPNGTYILNTQLKKSIHPITDSNANKPIYIVGESAYGVYLETTNDTKPLIDASRTKNVFIQNIFSKSSWFHVVQYGDDFREFSRVRDVFINNVGSLNREKGYPSWNIFINTPSPSNYNNEEVDSNYLRYAMEIVNNSGYNPIMINNFANTNEDGSLGQPSDQSAIGIIDDVSNASGAILIDGGRRAFYQCQNAKAQSKSAIRNNVIYEVDGEGHIAIGCSTQGGDTVATGVATAKLRDSYPRIIMYDTNRNNRQSRFGSSDNNTYIRSYDEDGNLACGLNMDYRNKTNIFTGSVQLGKLLTWEDTLANKNLNGICSIHVPSTITSRFENIDGGVEGQTVYIVSNGSLTINHNKDGWGNIRTSTSADIKLEKGVVYTITRVNGLWYLK